MSTALAVTEMRSASNFPFSRDQVDLIKRTIAKGATDDELRLFMAQCERTGLDPFDRQIYFIKRKQKNKKTGEWEEIGQTQTSIDGFRVVAERTGEMDGQDVAWCDDTGAWTDIWTAKTPPFAARVLCYRKGCQKPFPGIARYDEYAQTFPDGKPSGLWGRMPANMLAKCAEALALRKAFPKQLSGLYTRDEMEQAEPLVTEAPAVPQQGAPPPQHGFLPSAPNGGDSAASFPSGAVKLISVTPKSSGNVKATVRCSKGGDAYPEDYPVFSAQLASLAETLCQEGAPVHVDFTTSQKSGKDYITGLRRAEIATPAVEPLTDPIDADSIPF